MITINLKDYRLLFFQFDTNFFLMRKKAAILFRFLTKCCNFAPEKLRIVVKRRNNQ